MELFTFRITGVSPILQNNPAKMQASKDDSLKSGKRVYDPKIEAEAAVYRNERKEIVVPSIAFRASLFKAGTGRKIGKMSAKTVIAAAVFPVETHCILVGQKNNKPIKDYVIHSCRCVVNKAGIIRCRPLIDAWATDLVLELDTDFAPGLQKVVTELLNIAGKVAGVMDWRPERLGTFGRFTAELKA